MSVYSFPLKDSGCFTVAYDILDYHKDFILYINVLGNAGNLCYQSFAIYCIHWTYALLYVWTYFLKC